MKVILTGKVKSLGNIGEIVNVSSGFARNFLIPGKLAIVADKSNTRFIEDQKRRLGKKIAEQKTEAEANQSKLNNVVLEFSKKVGGSGKLFGTVTPAEIVKALESHGVQLERRQVLIPTPIKNLGEFTVTAKLFTDVSCDFKVKVVMDQNQAEELRKKQALAEKRAAAKKNAPAAEANENQETEQEEA